MNESQESLPSTDQPSDVPEQVQTVPETPTQNVDTPETEPHPGPSDETLNPAEPPTTPGPTTGPAQRPPRTQQILIIAVLVLIALSAIIFAIEVATQ